MLIYDDGDLIMLILFFPVNAFVDGVWKIDDELVWKIYKENKFHK